ncbi:sterol desaturase family protein [Flavobacteriaceae sp. LMIT009]
MEAYANALLYAIPGFVILILIEIAYGHFTNKQTHSIMDTISSLSSGVTNIIKDSLGLVVALISYPFLLKHLALFEIQATWLVYVVAFIAIDFASYWNHRLCHKVNFFWNIHVIHHSSEEFNLACALRQTISNIIGYYPVFLIPAAILGVPSEVIGLLAPIHLFAQFWYHTKHIGKLGILEYIFVTPSQHRVHHAINEEYIDKNLAAIFCVWDRWFGTFQEELDNVPPVYGVLKPVNTWNPIIINFQHLWRLIKDSWKTNSYLDKLRIWFMPTGWRPKDVAKKYPIQTIEDPYNFKKYEPETSSLKISWSLIQLVVTTVLMYFMFYNYGNLTSTELLMYGAIVFIGVFGYTTIMDNKMYGLIFELIFCGYGIYLILNSGDWFGINTYITYGSYMMLFYFAITVLGATYFSLFERRELAIA